MRIAAVGHKGIVGSTVLFSAMKLGHDVIGYDIRDENTTLESLLEFGSEIIYICVPTNVSENGKCDTSIVEGVVCELVRLIKEKNSYQISYNPIIAIKSTVTPGTTQRLSDLCQYHNLIFVPEFLRERCAIVDAVELHHLLAVGTHSDIIFNKVVKSHGHYPKNVVQLTPTEAEFLKYYHNAIAALRIIFANEMFDIAGALGIDYLAVKNALIKSTQLPDKYMDISKNQRGFGGTCLPKDTLALLHLANELDVEASLLETVIVKNQKYLKTVYPGMRG